MALDNPAEYLARLQKTTENLISKLDHSNPNEVLGLFLGGLGLSPDKPMESSQIIAIQLLLPPELRQHLCSALHLELILFEYYDRSKSCSNFPELFQQLDHLNHRLILSRKSDSKEDTMAVDAALSVLIRSFEEATQKENPAQLNFTSFHRNVLLTLVENGHAVVSALRDCSDAKRQFTLIKAAQDEFGPIARAVLGEKQDNKA